MQELEVALFLLKDINEKDISVKINQSKNTKGIIYENTRQTNSTIYIRVLDR